MRVACLQNCAQTNTDANLEKLANMLAQAKEQGADLAVFPEFGSHYGLDGSELDVGAAPQSDHPALARLTREAREKAIWLVAGSIGIEAPDGRTYNRSFLIDDEGVIRARYDKIHMFDVDLAGRESYRESHTIMPGDRAVVVDTPWARLGLSICYDVRFPHLYRELAKAGAKILTVPAAFTRKTGEAGHWHVLLRARAIETGCFVIAPCQSGESPDGRLKRYGHSLIISPWGDILAEGGEGEEVITVELDLDLVEKAREMVPALKNDRDYQGCAENPTAIAAE